MQAQMYRPFESVSGCAEAQECESEPAQDWQCEVAENRAGEREEARGRSACEKCESVLEPAQGACRIRQECTSGAGSAVTRTREETRTRGRSGGGPGAGTGSGCLGGRGGRRTLVEEGESLLELRAGRARG